MKNIPVVYLLGLSLLIVVATLALAQDAAPPAAEPNEVQQAIAREQRLRDEAFMDQKDAALVAIGKKELAKADTACGQLLSRFADHPDLAQGVYDIAHKYGEVGQTDKARQLYDQVMQRWHESEWAIHAQRDLIHTAIERGDDQATQAELDKLLTGFAQHKDIAGTIYNLGKHYKNRQRPDLAVKLHEYNVEHYGDDIQGMYSQVEIIKGDLASGDDAAVDAACNKLLATFRQQKTLPREIYQIGVAYSKASKPERAGVFYRHVLEQWPQSPDAAWSRLALLDDENRTEDDPAVEAALAGLLKALPAQDLSAQDLYRAGRDLARSRPQRALALHRYNGVHSAKDDKYTMWSQTELTKAYIRDGNEPAAEQAINDLIKDFAEQPTLSMEVARVGDTFAQAGQYDKAEQVYKYVREHWSEAEDTLWAKAGQVRLRILNNEDAAAETAFQQIVTDYANDPGLPGAVVAIGETYYEKGLRLAEAGRVKGQKRPESVPPAAEQNLRKAMTKWAAVIAAPTADAEAAAQALHSTIRAHYRLGEYQQVHELAARLVQQWPDYAEAWQVYPLVAKTCKRQMLAGQITKEEGLAALAQLKEQLQQQYPTSPPAARVRMTSESPRSAVPMRPTKQGGEK